MVLPYALTAQKSDDIRRTIGVSLPTIPLHVAGQFYQQKVGLQYRQCFKGYVFQAELNRLFQMEPPALYIGKEEGKYSYSVDETHYDENTRNLQRYLNAQLTLSKGWTNDRVNIYLGGGVSIGKSKLTYSSSIMQYQAALDSLGTPVIVEDISDASISAHADYFHIGAVLKASLEMKLLERLTLLIQFSPEISGAWRQKTNNTYFSKVNYATLTSSGIEIGVHFKL